MSLRGDAATAAALDEAAAVMVATADALGDVLDSSGPDRLRNVEIVADLEAEADSCYEVLMAAAADSELDAVTTESLYELAEALDEIVDAIDHAAHLVVDLDVDEIPDGLVVQADDILDMAELCGGLVSAPDLTEIIAGWRAINALETQVTRRARLILAELFDGSRDVFEALRLREISQSVETVADFVEQFARTVALAASRAGE